MFDRIRKILDKHFHLFALLFFIITTIYYMGPSVYSCKSTLYGFGDNTAGPIWRNSLVPAQPLMGGYEHATNYPVGETLYSPVSFSLVGQTILIWISSHLLGPICGYNLVNIIGFIFSAMAMYGLANWMIRSRWLSLLAGYAVSFSPYFQVKVGGHPGYGYQGLLILAIWSLFVLIKSPSTRRALGTAFIVGTSFYFDPYLSLLVMTCVVPILIVWLSLSIIRKKFNNDNFKNTIRYLAISGATLVLLLMPLATIFLANRSNISASVSALRGNVLYEARACSNLPHEYVLPFVLHPILKSVFGSKYVNFIDILHNKFSCGIGEDTVGISIILLAIVMVGSIVLIWDKLNRRKTPLGLALDSETTILGLSFMILVASLIALPPVRIHGLATPSYLLLHLTTTWRTLTRLYVVVNIGIVLLAAIYMNYISKNFRKYKKIISVLFALIFAVVVFEYQTSSPFSGSPMSTFNYEKDVPEIYTKVKNDTKIKNIAEYPLEKAGGESNATAYYLTMQVYHGKKLFNANNPLVAEEGYKDSLKNISDPQTLSVLKSVGIDTVIIHGVTKEAIEAIPGLRITYIAPQSPYNMLAFTPTVKDDITIVASINEDVPVVKDMMYFRSGFARNTNIIKSATDWKYEAVNGAEIIISNLPGMPKVTGTSAVSEPNKRCFYIAHTGDEKTQDYLKITVDDVQLEPIPVSAEYSSVTVSASQSIKLENTNGYNMRLSNLGCR